MNNLKSIASLYRGLLLFNLAILIVIIAIHPEQFSLLKDPLSWLGKVGPGERFDYYISFWFFSAALLFNIFRWIQIILQLKNTPPWEKFSVRFAFRLVLAGFVLMLFPCDRFDPIHSTGGSLVGLGMWAISAMLLFSLHKEFKLLTYSALHLFLHFSALYCIINFALDTALKGFSQRPAILAIVIVTNLCLKKVSQ